MTTPKLNGKHGELITKMYAKVGVLINDVNHIKESHKELKKNISDVQVSIIDLKVSTKGYAENLFGVRQDFNEHKKDHNRAIGRLIAILGLVATFVSIAVSVVFALFRG